MLENAEFTDEEYTPHDPARLRWIARCARKHGCNARIVGTAHVLVTSTDGGIIATNSAIRLIAFLGY